MIIREWWKLLVFLPKLSLSFVSQHLFSGASWVRSPLLCGNNDFAGWGEKHARVTSCTLLTFLWLNCCFNFAPTLNSVFGASWQDKKCQCFMFSCFLCLPRCHRFGVVHFVGFSRLWQSKHSSTDIRAGETLHHKLTQKWGSQDESCIWFNSSPACFRHILQQKCLYAFLTTNDDFGILSQCITKS